MAAGDVRATYHREGDTMSKTDKDKAETFIGCLVMTLLFLLAILA